MDDLVALTREYAEGFETAAIQEMAVHGAGTTDEVEMQALAVHLDRVADRIEALEAWKAEAMKALLPFAERAGKLDGLWGEHETHWSPEYGNTAITIGHLRAACRLLEKEGGR